MNEWLAVGIFSLLAIWPLTLGGLAFFEGEPLTGFFGAGLGIVIMLCGCADD